jgi:hypothetical protein
LASLFLFVVVVVVIRVFDGLGASPFIVVVVLWKRQIMTLQNGSHRLTTDL